MERRYKRAFVGYRKTDVDNMIASILSQMEGAAKTYENEKNSLLDINDRLKKEIAAAESEMRNFRDIQSQLEKSLYSGFMEACQKVYDTEKLFDESINSKAQVLKLQQEINDRIKSLTGGLLEQIKLIKGGESSEQ